LLGLIAVGGAMAGVVLPLVPTVPLLLVAAYAFSRSSPRLHRWLIEHPRFGPPIQSWRAHGAIERRHKLVAVGLMVATVIISLLTGIPPGVIVVQSLVLAGAASFILTRPDGPRPS
jgi:uncharacterized membrane protein YbaN (DUF454 family)